MSLIIFNPDNDMALADNHPGFTPPAHIQLMANELQDLLCGILPERPEPQVWGWSPAIVHRLRKAGVPAEQLPTRQQLEGIRRLSSRHTAVQLLQRIRTDLPHEALTGESCFCTTEDEIRDAMQRWPDSILKAPWSSSGKGIRYGREGEVLRGWYRRILRQQGGMVVEPLYPKEADLAMEFHSDGRGNVTFQGLSLFSTNGNGAYSGNIVCPEQQKMEWLCNRVPQPLVNEVIQWYERALAQEINVQYRGYLGVDMIISEKKLHPCIEMNLRMTMGMLSILLMQRQRPDYQGEFHLVYAPGEPLPQGATLLAGGDNYKAFLIEK